MAVWQRPAAFDGCVCDRVGGLLGLLMLHIALILFADQLLMANSQECGPLSSSNATCASLGLAGACCSKWGYCGTTIDYCLASINCLAECWSRMPLVDVQTNCGDNICNGQETCASCPVDCGNCFSKPAPTSMTDQCRPNTSMATGKYVLTFDDGPNGNVSTTLMQILQVNGNIPATFFYIGENALDPSKSFAIAEAVAQGHLVLGHTFSHPNMSIMAAAGDVTAIRRELSLQEVALRRSICHRRLRMFRQPYGEAPPLVVQTGWDMGYESIGWNLDTGDSTEYAGPSPHNTALIVESTKQQIDALYPQSIIHLQHELELVSVLALPEIIAYVRQKGYEFVRLDACLLATDDAWSADTQGITTGCLDQTFHRVGGLGCVGPADCNFNGMCVASPAGIGHCQCYPGWSCGSCSKDARTLSIGDDACGLDLDTDSAITRTSGTLSNGSICNGWTAAAIATVWWWAAA